jgi:ceramide glucosyltransferase
MMNLPLLHDDELLAWIVNCCIVGASLGCLYLITTSVLALRFTRERNMRHHTSSAVTILKPLHGSEPHLFGRLSSFCTQRYDGPIQVVFGAQDHADAAEEVVKRLETAFPEKAIVLKIGTQEYGANRKVSNLANMMALAQHDILIVADSDIQVGPHYLAAVVGELQRPSVGAVTCLYHGVAGAGIWSDLSALAINSHFLPQVVTALTFGLARPCFGATIAIRRQLLTSLGGFSTFANLLADDYAIGEAVRERGYEVVIPPLSVSHVCLETNFKSLFERQIRFARTIKGIDPVGYAGSIVTHPLAFALIGALMGSSGCFGLAVLALGCRIALCLSIERAFRLSWQRYWLLPILDLLAFAVYLVSFTGATVSWRDHRYRVSQDGGLAQVKE